MFAPSGLDAGLLVGGDYIITWPQRGAPPPALVEIENAASLASELPVAWEIQVRCLQGRNASWLSQRHRVVPLILATIPLAIASWRNSETDQRANGRPRRDGNSQASALIATMILGKSGLDARFVAVRRGGKALIVKTPAPLADNLMWCVEMFRDAGVPETLTRQQYDLRADNVTIGDAYSLDRASSCARSPWVRWITYGLLIGMTHPPGEDDPVMTARVALRMRHRIYETEY